MGNFDPVNESTENSRVKLLQIRVLLYGSDKSPMRDYQEMMT